MKTEATRQGDAVRRVALTAETPAERYMLYQIAAEFGALRRRARNAIAVDVGGAELSQRARLLRYMQGHGGDLSIDRIVLDLGFNRHVTRAIISKLLARGDVIYIDEGVYRSSNPSPRSKTAKGGPAVARRASLGKVRSAVKRYLRQSPTALSSTQIVAALAEPLAINPQSINVAIRQLAENGEIHQHANPTGRRRFLYSL